MSAKTKLNALKVLIYRALIDSNISHDEFALVNLLREYDMKEEIKKSKYLDSSLKFINLFIKQCYHTVWHVEKNSK